jgi:hypothetical protein
LSCAWSEVTWLSVALGCRYATTSTFCSVNWSPASRPVWMIQKPASSSSIRTMVAVAARLITALRQKPCQARPTLNRTKEITPQSSRW